MREQKEKNNNKEAHTTTVDIVFVVLCTCRSIKEFPSSDTMSYGDVQLRNKRRYIETTLVVHDTHVHFIMAYKIPSEDATSIK